MKHQNRREADTRRTDDRSHSRPLSQLNNKTGDAHQATRQPAVQWRAVVGVGASAGGLEALSELFEKIGEDHLTFIVMQHLSPTSRSLLPVLLQRFSHIRVVEACDGDELDVNVVYVVPPNTDIALSKGRLSVWQREEQRNHIHPIDFFFRSLAEDQRQRAIGIILSGTGTDGTEGLKAIQANGGTTFVQDSQSARFSEMPDSALRAGHASFCCSPTAMAQQLNSITQNRAYDQKDNLASTQSWFALLLARIAEVSKIDFTCYKPSTIIRRIERRSRMRNNSEVSLYIRDAMREENELLALAEDILINVTQFFRDADFYKYLAQVIVPALCVGTGSPTEPIRVWVSACATGEEAYSIAMLFSKHLAAIKSLRAVQIFATDLSKNSIAVARRGTYPLRIAEHVAPSLLDEFFVLKDGGYQVKPFLRSLVIFSEHNIIVDPPFSRMSLITCRNLLIYLRSSGQKQVFNRLHYALARHGFLALGTSESHAEGEELFTCRELRHKIYEKKVRAGSIQKVLPSDSDRDRPLLTKGKEDIVIQESNPSLIDEQIIRHAGLVGFVINEHDVVLYIRGQATSVLELQPGQVRLSLDSISNQHLRQQVQSAVDECRLAGRDSATSVKKALEGAYKNCFSVFPVQHDGRSCLLIIVQPAIADVDHVDEDLLTAHNKLKKNELIKCLQQNLERSRLLTANFQSANTEKTHLIQALATAREDSQARLEESRSMVEELETSREEMQSANEEITVVNEELRTRMEENSSYQSDLINILASVNTSFILLDSAKCLRRYSRRAQEEFGLTIRDLGKPISHIHRGFTEIDFDREIDQIHASRTIFASQSRWRKSNLYFIQMKCISNSSTHWGTYLSFEDVKSFTEDVQSLQRSQEHVRYAEENWGSCHRGLIAMSKNMEVFWVNQAACKLFGLKQDTLLGTPWKNLPLSSDLKNRVIALAEGLIGLRDETDMIQVGDSCSQVKDKDMQVQMHRRMLSSGKSFLTLTAKGV